MLSTSDRISSCFIRCSTSLKLFSVNSSTSDPLKVGWLSLPNSNKPKEKRPVPPSFYLIADLGDPSSEMTKSLESMSIT